MSPDRPRLSADVEFVGRDRERTSLEQLLDGLPTAGGALLVRGDPGVGKTTLLDYAEQLGAPKFPVLRVRGVETEMSLPFAALGELLLPLRRHFGAVPRAQRENLEAALALSERTPRSGVNPYAVCVATLNVLASAANPDPLVMLVDDLQWVDPDSGQVFRFLARRVASDRIAFVAASRTTLDDPGGFTTVEMRGMDEAECSEVLRSRGLAVEAGVLPALMSFSRGNPLILLEFTSRLSPAQRRGDQPLPRSPAAGQRAEEGWAARLRALPEPTHRALALVAAAREPTIDALEQALTATGLSLHDLTPAEEGRLVTIDEDRYEFVHPILRSVALRTVTAAVRRGAYRVLAEGATGAVRAWYRASAVTRPDEDVAAGLVTAAVEAGQCGSYLAAAHAWHRAAELTPESERSATRLLDAARNALLGGACDEAAAWCHRAQAVATDPRLRADIALLHGQALTWMGRIREALSLLVAAAELAAPLDTTRAALLAAAAVVPAQMSAEPVAAERSARRAMELSGGDSSARLALCQALCMTDRNEEANVAIDRMIAELAPADPATAAMVFGGVAHASLALDRFDDSQRLLHQLLDGARRTGDPAAYAYAFGLRSELGWRTGQWSAAYADGLESLAKAAALRHRGTEAVAHLALAKVDAARGDHATCERRVAEAFESTDFSHVRSMRFLRAGVLGLNSLSAGACADAAVHLAHAHELFVRCELGNLNTGWFAGELVEAHVRAGNPAAARDAMVWIEGCARRTGMLWQIAIAARGRALVADDPDEIEAAFRTALDAHERHPAPFDQARTLLCQGEWLRRARRKAQSRAPLLAAHRTFSQLGARPWVERCVAELAASGHAPPGDQPAGGLDRLSPQELQVARMVAEGLTNAEVGAALFISAKTVEAHLTHAYRKLGVRSRAGLTRVVTECGLD
ncbi:helix-turn-helix transcriptional regulator [Cryptosporangium phraense]|uniref:AAA family ATPase n=1 Tax=Cryptosporangium phraense TaxID=2593070 RepID=A0A545AM37_9ACTN|nr:LuxR family transcriptional regulator [Cryptosporangium phraense]TQS42378.1 AAA family ATPase [Cryptosporangium phraense]